MRTVSLNSQYLVLFKNPMDKTQVRILGQQAFPGNVQFLSSAYEDATSQPYGYLLVDIRPEVEEQYRVRTKIFDEFPIVYVPSRVSSKFL